jgi:hypothetical protein
MRHWLTIQATFIVSVISALLFVFCIGVVVGLRNWQPSPLFSDAFIAAGDLKANFLAYFSDVPVQHLRPNRFGTGGVTVTEPKRVAAGVTFVTGVFGQKFGARLYGQDGRLLYEWPINFFRIAPEEMAYPYDALIHGDYLYKSGDFVANLDGRGIVRVSRCGEIVWRNRSRSHHSIDVDEDGNLWTPVYGAEYHRPKLAVSPFRFDRIAQFNAETGKKLQEIDLVDTLVKSDLVGLAVANDVRTRDIMHLNDVEVLRSSMAAAFPLFSAGDILVSSRHFNQIWVLDGATHKIKWRFMGPMIGQHDPDFEPDGTITLFDNQPGGPIREDNNYIGNRGGSRILSVDPEKRTFKTLYESDDENLFYTPFRGKHQSLSNGNRLITEPDTGRAFEVTSEGEVVWSLVNAWDDHRIGWVMKATRYPAEYAAVAKMKCP